MSDIRRIALLSVHTSPLAALGGSKTGGMNVYVRELTRELARRGFAVDVFTRNYAADLPLVDRTLGLTARVIHIVAGPVAPLEPDAVAPYLPEFERNLRAFVAQDGTQSQYDFIFSHYWLSGVVAHGLREAWGIPIAQMFHTLGRMKDRIAKQPERRTERDLMEADVMSWADCIVAATRAEVAQILWLYNARRSRIEVVPPGVDLARFHPRPAGEARAALGLAPGQKMLLFVGRIEPLKAVDTIFEALALLKHEVPDLVHCLRLNIIGGDPDDPARENDEMERLKALRIALGLAEQVAFLGAKDQDALVDYYTAAEALIMPSDYESFGMVALEAMASGTPVIASEVGGLAFLVQDGVNGFHVPVRDARALANAMRRILAEPQTRARLAADAAGAAQAYSWVNVADRLLAVFERVRGAMKGA